MENKVNAAPPEMGPGEVPKKAGVRRVNNMPIYIIGGAVAIFLLIMLMVASNRGSKKDDGAVRAEVNGGSTKMFAEEIAGTVGAGIVAEANPSPLLEALDLNTPPLLIARAGESSAPEVSPSQETEIAQRLKAMKMQQLQLAIVSKTEVRTAPARSPGSARTDAAGQQAAARAAMMARSRDSQQPAVDPSATGAQFQNALSQIRSASGLGAGMGMGGGDSRVPDNDISQFGAKAPGDRWKLDNQLEAPRSAFELRAGFVIPATLISGINSDLPGQIIGQVSQDVYDTATGKYKLVPQGSRLVGSYSSDVAYGQSRVLVAWQRIIFPDGKAMDIGAMPGADSGGYAGFSDKVNNHYVRLFGSAFLLSGITAGITLSQNSNDGTTLAPNAQSTMSAALGQQLGQVAVEMIRKNMNIAPTIEIRPGFRFNVTVVKDLTFTKPYQAFDY